MQDKKHLKVQGIRFARSLQTLVKMVNMFTADHRSASGLLQRTYELLTPVVRQSRSFTVGFIDQRVLLNNILTLEESLKPLETEFRRRGIGAITFDAGITLGAFREAIAIISTNPRLIQEKGGLISFLGQKQLDFVRLFPASSIDPRNEDGDTVLEVGSEEFLISKALNKMNGGFQDIDSLLNNMEAGDGPDSGVFRDAAPGPGRGGTGFGSGTAEGASLSGNASFAGSPGQPNSPAADVQRIVDQKFDASLQNPDEDPDKVYVELARMLRSIPADSIATSLGSDQVRAGAPGQGITADVFEDSALRWAMKRLATLPAGEEGAIIEEQVFRVLMRSLQATHAAARMANKLAEYAKEYALPPQVLERIRGEVRWLTLTPQQKLCELLGITHFSAAEFRRCLELIREFIRLGEPEQALALGLQYLSVFERPLELEMQDVTRVPELLRSLAGTHGEFWDAATEWIAGAVLSKELNWPLHCQTVNALATLARTVATYDQFALVQKAGIALEKNAAADPAAHSNCCISAVKALIPPSAVDRIAEMFFEKKNDSSWLKLAGNILRWAGSDAIERIFIALDNEVVAANRLALLRLLARLGGVVLEPARKRLQRPEWYVVRNACKILGELKDPELLQHLQRVFAVKDERVQKAALHAIVESRLPGTAAVLAGLLPELVPAIYEDVFYELIVRADPESLPGLERCLCSPLSTPLLTRVVHAVAAIKTASAEDLLGRVCQNDKLPQLVRDTARQALDQRHARKSSMPPPACAVQKPGYAGA